ncbi:MULTISPECIES: SIMPL domain-containing protein [unclassified Treponema]|uniref:SIMPL domain-containing protein n=1 Tax=unclassified Treponema TaxID=2638727 RepID=UPI0020A46884|nr:MULTISPECIES: SIMPL domain-containing protein [unclassified Treponema]UTC68067.1 SIMPL domain-containing protein [Treponema sp. OMZ 789]UTC70789.1 SIMPL domain-containing protein [Treponema sp. OMZ 790]UTC73529.1 SIMPL domain-containing protein [Treponema sp. OMZ 791]
MKNSIIKSIRLIGVLYISFILFNACSPAANEARFISVTGRSAILKSPDQVSISFSVFSKDKDLSEAKNKNDVAILKLKELFEKYKIEQKNISIERVNINPRYRYRDNGNEYFDGYEVVQNIAVLLTKIEDYEVFLTDLLNTGVDRIYNVGFSVADMRKLMDEARVTAVKAAEEKANLLCKAASNGGKPLSLGKIISISENPSGMSPRGYTGAYAVQNMKQAYDESSDGNFSPMGQIEVSAEVNIVFELEF